MISHCLTTALRCERSLKVTEWREAIAALPTDCQHPGECTGDMGCQDRNRQYLKAIQQRRKAKRG